MREKRLGQERDDDEVVIDLEKQKVDESIESPLSQLSPEVYFSSWLFLNIALTLLNKAVFQFGDFTFPLTLSAVHMIITGGACWVCVNYLKWFPRNNNVDSAGMRRLYAFSFLFCINILIGNISIRWVPVSLVQIFRAVIPGITIVLSFLILGKTSSWSLCLTMIPICVGVMLTVRGEVSTGWLGMFFTAFGAFLSSAKVVVCNRFLSGSYKMNAVDLLARVAPMAFVQMLVAVYFFEWERLSQNLDVFFEPKVFSSVLLSGVMAFLLNVTNFFTNQKTSPLTLTVGGNVKQVLTIVLSIVIFQNPVTLLSSIGMIVTLVGAAIYSAVKYKQLS